MNTGLDYKVVETMEKYGGSFVKALAECFRRADSHNFLKLYLTFGEYWEQYRKMSGFMACKDCNGQGWTTEHDAPSTHNPETGECMSCPAQVQCGNCEGTGVVEAVCERCNGEGKVEKIGDGENFECDVVGTKPCPECSGSE